MRLLANNHEYEVTPDNGFLLYYANDMMDGLYVDLDNEYLYLSANTTLWHDLQIEDICAQENISAIRFDNKVDWTSPPHCYVLASLGRMVISTAESEIE